MRENEKRETIALRRFLRGDLLDDDENRIFLRESSVTRWSAIPRQIYQKPGCTCKLFRI